MIKDNVILLHFFRAGFIFFPEQNQLSGKFDQLAHKRFNPFLDITGNLCFKDTDQPQKDPDQLEILFEQVQNAEPAFEKQLLAVDAG